MQDKMSLLWNAEQYTCSCPLILHVYGVNTGRKTVYNEYMLQSPKSKNNVVQCALDRQIRTGHRTNWLKNILP